MNNYDCDVEYVNSNIHHTVHSRYVIHIVSVGFTGSNPSSLRSQGKSSHAKPQHIMTKLGKTVETEVRSPLLGNLGVYRES